MPIHPQQAIDIAGIRLQHDAANLLVDTHRAHVRVCCIADNLIVDTGCPGVLPKLGNKLHDPLLLLLAYFEKAPQEVIRHCHLGCCLHVRILVL